MTTELYEYDDIPDGVKTISAQKILDSYWEFWYTQMAEKYGEDHYLFTKQNCIDDWVVSNYAWKKVMKKTDENDKVFILEQVLVEIGALYEEETSLNRMNYLHHLKKNLEEIIDELRTP